MSRLLYWTHGSRDTMILGFLVFYLTILAVSCHSEGVEDYTSLQKRSGSPKPVVVTSTQDW